MQEKSVEIISVIRTTLLVRGEGAEARPTQKITQFWSLTGDLLAEVDPSPSVAEVAKADPARDAFMLALERWFNKQSPGGTAELFRATGSFLRIAPPLQD
jgi:hypothetical protein